jgi:predicted protein tyrosine phosphatase
MTPYLKLVVNTLHKDKTARRVFALSRAEAEQLPFFAHVGLISVTAPNRSTADLAHFEHLLRLSFADVDHLSSGLSARARSKIADAMTPAQAIEVVSFVQNLPLHVTSVVAHCEGGYSRSCAIALVLHERFKYAADVERLSMANESVLRLLRRAASEQPK